MISLIGNKGWGRSQLGMK